MISLKFKLGNHSVETMYNSFLLPTMEYANIVWEGTYDFDISKREKIHIKIMRLITRATACSNIVNLYMDTASQSVSERWDHSMLKMLFKIENNLAPEYLIELLPPVSYERVHYNFQTTKTWLPPILDLRLSRDLVFLSAQVTN